MSWSQQVEVKSAQDLLRQRSCGVVPKFEIAIGLSGRDFVEWKERVGRRWCRHPTRRPIPWSKGVV
jgi:hypothetical protein